MGKAIGKLRRGFPIAMYRDWGPRLRWPLPPDAHKISVAGVVSHADPETSQKSRVAEYGFD